MMNVARIPTVLVGVMALAIAAASAATAERTASSAAEVAAVLPDLHPGDTLVLADGTWKDQKVAIKATGTADQPVTVRAQTPGKVVLTGASSLTVDGEYVVVSGVYLKDFTGERDGLAIPGSHCRLTDCALEGGTTKFFLHVIGVENRVDHCYLAGKTSGEPTMQIEVPAGKPNHDRVDHNHFGPRPPLGRNGGETLRVGYSGQSMSDSLAVVESNLFDRCDGELEIISSKSCGNVYRYNTFLDCDGTLTLRHGNRCLVDANFFIAHHKKGSGGVRVIGEDHVITNNYFDGIDKGAFWITSGVPNSALKEYFQAKRCVIAFNTVVDSAGPYLDLSAGLGTSKRTLKPEAITVANNVFAVGPGGTLLKGTEGENWTWRGNVFTGAADVDHPGLKPLDPKLARSPADGLWRPAADSPAHGAAQGDWPHVQHDVDGQPRKGKLDVGCDQASTEPVTNRPLTAADVGPSWLARTSGEPRP